MINNLVDTRRLINENILYIVNSNIKSCELVCDSTQLNRVMVNLLQNAEEALEGVKEKKKIIVQIILEGDFVSIAVLDNGPGFTDQVLENAIKSYFTTKTKGTGLGLAIVDRIIQDHFGSFGILNREEGGGEVRLTLNIQKLRMKINQTL
jgi:hypothetical protein